MSKPKRCEDCEGRGWVRKPNPERLGMSMAFPFRTCDGSGKVAAGGFSTKEETQ